MIHLRPQLSVRETAVIIGGGPSFDTAKAEGITLAQQSGAVSIIAIGNAWKLFPNADIIYSWVREWWLENLGRIVEVSKAHLVCGQKSPPAPVHHLRLRAGRNIAPPGVHYVMCGHCSGFQALGLAAYLGAREIIAYGLDGRMSDTRSHWYEGSPVPSEGTLHSWREDYASFRKAARLRGLIFKGEGST